MLRMRVAAVKVMVAHLTAVAHHHRLVTALLEQLTLVTAVAALEALAVIVDLGVAAVAVL
jgi:hypothetical protein